MENKNQIKFESLETKIDIGRWLAWIGLIKDKKLLKKFKIKAYHQIEIAEILTKLNIHTKLLDDINNHFSKILNQIGINEPCTIKPYEDYYQNFICHLEKTNEDILIKLTMGGFFDGHTVLRTKKENITKEYKPIVNRETNEIKVNILKDLTNINIINDVSVYIELDNENYHNANIIGLSLYNKEISAFIPYETLEKNKDFLTNLNIITYDIKRLYVSLAKRNIILNNLIFDTMISGYLLNYNIKDDVAYLANNLGYELNFYNKKEKLE